MTNNVWLVSLCSGVLLLTVGLSLVVNETATAQTTLLTPSPNSTVNHLYLPYLVKPAQSPTATPTQTPDPACIDDLEFRQADNVPILTVSQPLVELTLYPFGDTDQFQVWGKPGRYYQLTTYSDEGVDTRLQVYHPNGDLLTENDDFQTATPTSQVQFRASDEGWYRVMVDSQVPLDWGCRRYGLRAIEVATPTATPQPRLEPAPQPTAVPASFQPDAYEPNFDFASATNLGVGQQVQLNFNPYPAGTDGLDHDFFRLHVKRGQHLQIETRELAPGLDTNLILYQENQQVIEGNDDCTTGELRSCLTWTPNHTGFVYLLVGPVGTVPEATSSEARAYSLMVADIAEQLVTSQPQPVADVPTPVPPSATPVPLIVVRRLNDTAETATPETRQVVQIAVTLYYDENDNQAPDPNEGMNGISIRVLEEGTNQQLGHLFTDSRGYAQLMVSTVGAVRISVPYLGFNQRVRPPGEPVVLRLNPQRLPSLIP